MSIAGRMMTMVCAALMAAPAHGQGWSNYGADPGGARYSSAAQINRENVRHLRRAWTFHIGDAARGPVSQDTALEVTPILAGGSLVLCSPFNEVIALDPGTGRVRWRYDPRVGKELRPGNHYVCRGVAYWRDTRAKPDQPCASRILSGLTDGRLLALDLRTGRPCAGFGRGGQVQTFPANQPLIWKGEAQITSPPVVVADRVVVGGSISDNWRAHAPSGAVRAYDVRTGKLAWSFDPAVGNSGGGNVWAPMSVDEKRGMVFLPTTSPSPDFFGGQRIDGPDTNAVVALDGATGRKLWSFQTVHHDVWDYDLPAQPSLVTIRRNGRAIDAVVQVTKTGFVFVLDRTTGKPLFPVVERSVPQGGVAGERLSATQPIPLKPAPLVPQRLTPDMAWGLTPWDRGKCRDLIAASRSGGLFTPPSERGTILYPFTGGGANWGGAAFDPASQTLYVNTSRAAHRVTLIPSKGFKAAAAAAPGVEVRPQAGTPWAKSANCWSRPSACPAIRRPGGC